MIKIKYLLIKLVSLVRGVIMRKVKPANKYFLATRSLRPISVKFGFDRGKPIDRYYIEKFLEENKKFIKGRSLEIVDNKYSVKYGGSNVVKSDVLDMFPTKIANIHGNLKNLKRIVKDDTYDCLIITHTFGMIDDYDAAIKECYRILKPGGSLLVTVSSFSPTHDIEHNFWRFTTASAKLVFGKYFKDMKVKSYGNVFSGQCFWVGLAMEDLTQRELDYNDPSYPCIVTVWAKKEK